MNNADRHQLIGQTLTTLAGGLSPFVTRVLNRVTPPGTNWAELLRAKDAANGRGGDYQGRDVALMLRAMTERLGALGYPFKAMPRQAEIYAKEMREVRNKWARTGEFTDAEAYRAIDSAELLLRAIGAAQTAERVHKLKAAVAPQSATPTPTPTSAQTAQTPKPETVAPADAQRIDISADGRGLRPARSATGSSSIDGYQSENPDRVDAIGRAVFDTVKARDIRYAEPPASWGDAGRKVRTPAEAKLDDALLPEENWEMTND